MRLYFSREHFVPSVCPGSFSGVYRYIRWVGLVLLGGFLFAGFFFFPSCSEPPKCDKDRPCSGTLVCLNGKCERKRCSLDEECAPSDICDKVISRCKRRPGPTWECRTDSECRQGEICEGGLCRIRGSEPRQEVTTPDRDPNACVPTCRQGFKCDKGLCVELAKDPPCKFNSDCKDDRKCNIAVDLCQFPCTTDVVCKGGRKCVSGFCQFTTEPECSDKKPCTAPKQCLQGKCVEPECHAQKPCSAPKICKSNKCIEPECHDKKPCPSPKVCRNNKCEAPPNKCDGATPCTASDRKCFRGQCQPKDYCEKDTDCNNQKCYKNACGACQQTSDCQSFEACQQGKCVTVEKKIGEACKASAECVKNATCAGDRSGKQACRKICKPLDANPGCDPGTGCALLGKTFSGGCFPVIPNGLQEGADCTGVNKNKCAIELTCVGQGNNSSLCMRYCNQNQASCPNQGKCLSIGSDPVGVCEIKGGSGNVKPGQACKNNAECTKGAACVAAGGGIHKIDICMTLCNPTSPSCPNAASCVGTSNPSVGVCQPSCRKKADCASGLCLGGAGAGTCTTGCDPYQAVCSSGQTCDVVPDPSGALKGVCGPASRSGLATNGVCLVGAFACKVGLICIALIRNSAGNLVGRCGIPCQPGSTNCPRGTFCKRSTSNLVGGKALFGCIQ